MNVNLIGKFCLERYNKFSFLKITHTNSFSVQHKLTFFWKGKERKGKESKKTCTCGIGTHFHHSYCTHQDGMVHWHYTEDTAMSPMKTVIGTKFKIHNRKKKLSPGIR